jgi:hypothetical protein
MLLVLGAVLLLAQPSSQLSRHAGGGVEGMQPRRTTSVSGRVIRSNGAAAPGINVVLAVRRGRELVPLTGTQTTTSWDGRYTIKDVPPGTYLLLAQGVAKAPAIVSPTEQAAFEINQIRPEDFTPTLYPGVPATDAGDAITLLEGVPAEGIDIWLAPARHFSIAGRATWPDGYVVEHLTIEYGNPTDRRASVWNVSDPGGLFTIDGVAPGPVILLATAESNRGPLMGVVSTDVRVGDIEDLTLPLTVPGSVTGRVAFARDIPIASRPKTIALVPKLLNVSPLYTTPEAPIGVDGSFRVDHVLGEYELALPGLPLQLRITGVSRNGRTLAGNRLGIVAGETIDGIVVTVGP